MTARPTLEVVHNERASRFEAHVPEGLCRADYRRVGNALHMVHTEVPARARGHDALPSDSRTGIRVGRRVT